MARSLAHFINLCKQRVGYILWQSNCIDSFVYLPFKSDHDECYYFDLVIFSVALCLSLLSFTHWSFAFWVYVSPNITFKSTFWSPNVEVAECVTHLARISCCFMFIVKSSSISISHIQKLINRLENGSL